MSFKTVLDILEAGVRAPNGDRCVRGRCRHIQPITCQRCILEDGHQGPHRSTPRANSGVKTR